MCQIKWKSSISTGENHPNWKGGDRNYRKTLMNTGKKKTCSLYYLEDERVLAVHHVDHNRKNNDPSNLTWLCWNCHYLIHHDKAMENILKIKIQDTNLVLVA